MFIYVLHFMQFLLGLWMTLLTEISRDKLFLRLDKMYEQMMPQKTEKYT